jgi:4-amino-4-deoxy-L-arabinose transferase-like glycosyltransferase
MASVSSTSETQTEPPVPRVSEGSRLPTKRLVLVLLALSSLLYLGTAFSPALLDDADASHALVSRAMLERGDWVVMYLNGVRYLQKAPLHYWWVAIDYLVLGQNAFATRLPVALAMIGLVLMGFELGRHFFGTRAGFYSGLVLATSAGMFVFTRIMIPEAIYALEFTIIFYLFLRAWTGSLPPRAGYWGAAAVTGLAVLTRGLVGLVFPLGGILGFLVLTRSWNRWRELPILSSTLIFLLVAAPWHLLAAWRAPGFLWSYFINEHFNRALGTRWPPDYDAVPLWLWWLAHLAWFFPWSVFVPFALKQLPEVKGWGRGMPVEEQARLLLFVWAGVILGFFSILGGSRMEYYSFGAWPAIAILLGLGLARAEDAANRWLLRLQATMAALGGVLAAVLVFLVWHSYGIQSTEDISQLLRTHNSLYRLSMGHLLDLTPQAFADLRAPALLAAAAFALAPVVAWRLRRQGHRMSSTLAIAAGMAVFFVAANLAYARFEPQMSSYSLARAVQRYLRPGDQLAIYGEFDAGSSMSFYLHRQAWIYNGRYNNLAFGSRYPDAPRIFLDDGEFSTFWRGPQRIFLFVPANKRQEAAEHLHGLPKWKVIELGGKIVYVNKPLEHGTGSLARLQGGAANQSRVFVSEF